MYSNSDFWKFEVYTEGQLFLNTKVFNTIYILVLQCHFKLCFSNGDHRLFLYILFTADDFFHFNVDKSKSIFKR